MKMRQLFLGSILAVMLGAMSVSAQTPSFKISWDSTDTVVNAQGFQYTLQVDTATPTAITPACVAYSGPAVVPPLVSTCTAPFPKVASGNHTVSVTAFNGFGSATGGTAGGPPASFNGVRVTVTIQIP